jgi:hypothetical protein
MGPPATSRSQLHYTTLIPPLNPARLLPTWKEAKPLTLKETLKLAFQTTRHTQPH